MSAPDATSLLVGAALLFLSFCGVCWQLIAAWAEGSTASLSSLAPRPG